MFLVAVVGFGHAALVMAFEKRCGAQGRCSWIGVEISAEWQARATM
jgi:hypothetical protein